MDSLTPEGADRKACFLAFMKIILKRQTNRWKLVYSIGFLVGLWCFFGSFILCLLVGLFGV